jgi:hypothetical protein
LSASHLAAKLTHALPSGSELDILRGAEKALRSCSLIDVEVAFNELYQRQPLFCDIDRFLRDQGFVLWRFSHLVHYSPSPVIGVQSDWSIDFHPIICQTILASDGQVFWAQAQYVRAEFPRTGTDNVDRNRALAAAAVVGSYDHWDLALELIRKSADKQLLEKFTDAVGVVPSLVEKWVVLLVRISHDPRLKNETQNTGEPPSEELREAGRQRQRKSN